MRISHDSATNIAEFLTDKSKKEAEQLRKEITADTLKQHLASIPKEVIDLSKKHPKWVATSGCLYAYYDKHNYLYVPLDSKVIMAGSDRPKVVTSKILKAKIVKFNKLEEQRKLLKKETTRAILELGTVAKVIAQFPETKDYFSKKQALPKSLVESNISKLKEKLNKQ
jgi:hypothetical protein